MHCVVLIESTFTIIVKYMANTSPSLLALNQGREDRKSLKGTRLLVNPQINCRDVRKLWHFKMRICCTNGMPPLKEATFLDCVLP